jgi:hypothetical protein
VIFIFVPVLFVHRLYLVILLCSLKSQKYICHCIFHVLFENVFERSQNRHDPTHYFCDFNCLLLLLNHASLREVFFSQKLTFIRLTLKAIYVLCNRYQDSFIIRILGCIFTWSCSSSYVNNPV